MRFGLLAGVLLIAVACAGAPPSAATPVLPDTRPTTAAPLAQAAPAVADRTFSGARARQHVDALSSQIGSRPAGSPGVAAAAQYASDQLRGWGYQPTLQPFPVRTFQDRGARIAVVDGVSAPIAAETLQYSPSGILEAPLVAAGLGTPDELAAVDVSGKIALLKRGTLRFAEKVSNAAAAGAAGVVVFNDQSGRVQGSLGNPGAIPSVTISEQDGQALQGLLAAGPVGLRLEVDAAVETRQANNVVAEKPGTQPGAGTVVIGGHLDSVPAGPGANDNASGSAAVLELARALAARDYPYTLRFVLFDAEELGLYGSQHYVSELTQAERRSIVAMINLDMVGVGQAWRFGGADPLVQEALGAAIDLGVPALPMRGQLNSSSDHASFMAVGIPSLFLYRTEDPNYHTANDRADFVDPAALEQAGIIALRVLDSLADDA